MNRINMLARLCLTVFVVSSFAALGGCASDQKKAPAPAAAPATPPPQPVTLGKIKSELLDAKVQIDATTASLNTLQKSSTADAQTNYNKFAEEYT